MDSTGLGTARLRDAILGVLGIAAALMVLEIQRMPVAHVVSFSMFAPVPYVFEAAAIGAAALVVRRERHLAAAAPVRGLAAVCAVLSTWLLLWDIGFDDTVMPEIRIAYRISTGLLVVLWGERLIPLGAAGCLVSGIATFALAFLPQPLIDAVMGLLPVVAGAALLAFRAEAPRQPAPARPLPVFSWGGPRERWVAVGLIGLPLLSRGTTISTQYSWMPLQQQAVSTTDFQMVIGLGIVLGAAALGLVIRFAWNRSFVLVFDLVVVPVTFLSFYTAQLADELWALHLLIVDSTYKVALFYVLMSPYLFPSRDGRPPSSAPLYGAFAFMIGARALFSGLHAALSPSAYAAVAVVTVVAVFAGAAVLALLYVHQQVSAGTEDGKAAPVRQPPSPSGAGAAPEGPGVPVRPDTGQLCAALGDRFELTPREREVLFLLAQNYRAPYIAEKLVVSQSTVKTHMRNLYGKLGVHSQAELLLLVDREADGRPL